MPDFIFGALFSSYMVLRLHFFIAYIYERRAPPSAQFDLKLIVPRYDITCVCICVNMLARELSLYSIYNHIEWLETLLSVSKQQAAGFFFISAEKIAFAKNKLYY